MSKICVITMILVSPLKLSFRAEEDEPGKNFGHKLEAMKLLKTSRLAWAQASFLM